MLRTGLQKNFRLGDERSSIVDYEDNSNLIHQREH